MTQRMAVGSLHHVTAMSGAAHESLEFYEQVIGLRLVKTTVNFDDPGTYHLYFGDDTGAPGTVLTFFPWPLARPGRRGAGQCVSTALAVPTGCLPYWEERLASAGIPTRTTEQFGRPSLAFEDVHGLALELIETDANGGGGSDSDVPGNARVQGFFGVTLLVREETPTVRMFEALGYDVAVQDGPRTRLSGGHGPGGVVDLLVDPNAQSGAISKGSVHHIAFRLADDDAQAAWLEHLRALGVPTSPIMDRNYFRSIYFHEPSGVLLELATDVPGFTVDEPRESLGTTLRLPAHLEGRRAQIEANLPPLRATKDA